MKATSSENEAVDELGYMMEVGRMRMSLKGGILLLFLFSVYVAPGCTTETIQTAETVVENVNRNVQSVRFYRDD